MRPRYWLLALLLLAGGAVAVTAQLIKKQTLPSPQYLDHPPQYISPTPPGIAEYLAAERQPATPAPTTNETTAATPELPVAQAVLFSSGVGYFQREGIVDGTARVDLTFPVRDVNDLLKSMVVRDLDGGRVAAVSYDSNAPVEKTLTSFAINLTGNPSLAAILHQARGEKVEAVTGGGTYTGTVVGVERQKVAVGKETMDCDVLNLSCADGLRSCKMLDVQRVRFLNPIMESELRKALETLAQSHDTQKKAVSINFVGEGKRNVRVGYVVENPIWKTSYRLVLGKEKDAKPYLQGWAVVENVSDEDWKDVRVALVSGRPISFQMDLYQPLFVPRPTVVPELFASMQPRVYSGDLKGNEYFNSAMDDAGRDAGGYVMFRQTQPLKAQVVAARGFVSPSAGIPNGPGATNATLAGVQIGSGEVALDIAQPVRIDNNLSLQKGVGTVASATKLGDFFQYVIEHPVTLPRQKSAMLPIVGREIEATRVSIYNEATLGQHPLLGVKLKNTSGLHLMQGPITVFENGSYAGDARILDLQPNEERLLSYAIDLGTEVKAVPSSDNGRLTVVKAVKGILYTTTKVRETRTYTIVNRNDAERVVLIEHPVRNEFKLTDTDKPAETASDYYRFQVKVAAGKTEEQGVTEERTLSNSMQITNLDDDNIRVFIKNPATPPQLRVALSKALDLRAAQAKTKSELNEVEVQLRSITEDQGRLRANLKEMPPTAAAYKRYLDKFDAQETEIEKLQAKVKVLSTKVVEQQQEFETYLMGLDVESAVGGPMPVPTDGVDVPPR
jgi:hypothetical protein